MFMILTLIDTKLMASVITCPLRPVLLFEEHIAVL